LIKRQLALYPPLAFQLGYYKILSCGFIEEFNSISYCIQAGYGISENGSFRG
jgi:hypothetical protein